MSEEARRIEALERAQAGLLVMNRLLTDRVRLVERRCEQLEQAASELDAALRRPGDGSEGEGHPFRSPHPVRGSDPGLRSPDASGATAPPSTITA